MTATTAPCSQAATHNSQLPIIQASTTPPELAGRRALSPASLQKFEPVRTPRTASNSFKDRRKEAETGLEKLISKPKIVLHGACQDPGGFPFIPSSCQLKVTGDGSTIVRLGFLGGTFERNGSRPETRAGKLQVFMVGRWVGRWVCHLFWCLLSPLSPLLLVPPLCFIFCNWNLKNFSFLYFVIPFAPSTKSWCFVLRFDSLLPVICLTIFNSQFLLRGVLPSASVFFSLFNTTPF